MIVAMGVKPVEQRRALSPICRNPVGERANRVTTGAVIKEPLGGAGRAWGIQQGGGVAGMGETGAAPEGLGGLGPQVNIHHLDNMARATDHLLMEC